MTTSDNESAVAFPGKHILMAIKEEPDENKISKLWEKFCWYMKNDNTTCQLFCEIVRTINDTDGLLLSLLNQFGTTHDESMVCLLVLTFRNRPDNANEVFHQATAAPDSKFLDNFLDKVSIRKNSSTIDDSIRILYYLSLDQCNLCDQCHLLPILSEFLCRYVADKPGDKLVVEGFSILVANLMGKHSREARLVIMNSGIFIGVTRVLKSRFDKNNSSLDLDNYVEADHFTSDLDETCILNIWFRAFLSITEDLEFCNRDTMKDALGLFMPFVSHYIKQLLKAGTLPSDSFDNILGILRIVKHLKADGLECILINAPNILSEDFNKLIILLEDKKDQLLPRSSNAMECIENMFDSVKSVLYAISLLIEIILRSSFSLPSVSQSMLCIMPLIEHNYEPWVLKNRDSIMMISTTFGRWDDLGRLGRWPPKTGFEGKNAIEISLEIILTLIKKEPQTVIKILLNDGGIKSLIDLIKRLKVKDHRGYNYYNEIILRNKISRIILKMVKGFSVADHEMTIHLVPFLKESLHKIILKKNIDSLLDLENGSHTYICNVLQTVKNIAMSHDPKLVEAVTKEGNLLNSCLSVLNLSKNEKVLVSVLQIMYILTSKNLFRVDLLRTKISALWRKRRVSSKSDILIAKLLTSYFLKMSVSYTNTKFAEYYLEQFLKLDSFKFAIEMPGALWLYWTICRSKRNCIVLKILERRSEDTSIDIEFGDIKAAKVYKYLCDIIIEIIDRDPPCDSKHLMDLTKCMIKIAESTSSREELFVLEDLVPASMELSGRIEDKIVIENIKKFLSIID